MRYLINTVNTKIQQLSKGYFQSGYGSGSDVMLVVGSCRSVPYLNYINYLNAGNRFSIHFIDPFNFNYDSMDRRVDFESAVNQCESNAQLLDLLKRTRYYIHEYYNSFGMFNSSRDNPKNIYQFGLNPEYDICIPNFNDIFILFQDIVDFCPEVRKDLQADIRVAGAITNDSIERVRDLGLINLEKFFTICKMSSFPDMESLVRNEWRIRRFFWNSNHVSKHFTISIFKMLNDQFLKMDADSAFWDRINNEDMFSTPHTPMTNQDVKGYGLMWNEMSHNLRI